MPGTYINSTDIINRFNTIVTNGANMLNNATWYSGNFPNGTDGRLGNRWEGTKSAGQLTAATQNQLNSTIVFNVLHGFAMELTRVRRVEAWHRTDTAPLHGGKQLTALNSNFAAYFPIPFQPIVGERVTDLDLDNFLTSLRNEVNKVRTTSNDNYKIDIVTCHNSCHSSCHASRNRR